MPSLIEWDADIPPLGELIAEAARADAVRSAVLGHVQQGGSPSPFDRIQASRLAAAGIEELVAKVLGGDATGTMVGFRGGNIELTPLASFPELVEPGAQRPRDRTWWSALRPLVDLMGQPDAK